MATITVPGLAERVAAGVAWLDQNVPDWSGRIDLGDLNLAVCDDCILGQVFGNYWDAPLDAERSSDGKPLVFGNYDAVATGLGFQGNWFEYKYLGTEWRRVILARRAAMSPSAAVEG
jgi:hypothetical protein